MPTEMEDMLKMWTDCIQKHFGNAVAALKWTDDKLKVVFGLNDVTAKWLSAVMFLQIIVITSFAVVIPSEKYPKETIIWILSLLLFMYCTTADFLAEKKREKTEKESIDEIQSTDKQKIFSLEDLREFFPKENETLERCRLEMSFQYHSLLKDHIRLKKHCEILATQAKCMKELLEFNDIYTNPEPIPEVKLLGQHRYSLFALTPNRDLLEERIDKFLSNKQTGLPCSTERPNPIESSEDKSIKSSANPEKVKFTIGSEDPVDDESVKSAEHTETIEFLEVSKNFMPFSRARSAKFLANSETVKFSADSRDVKFIANGPDLKSEDTKEGEWEVVDAII